MTLMPLQLPPGIIHGANPDDVPGRWFDGNMVRWRDGIMEPIGGWEKISSTPLPTVPRRIHEWLSNINTRAMLIGSETKLHALVDGVFVDVTPGSFIDFSNPGSAT